jgi:predicted amidohydrolase
LVKVALAQAHLQVGDVPGNIFETVKLINKASEQGAQIVVLPELSNTGYVFESKEELKNILKNDNCLEVWQKESKDKQIIIVAGFAQEINNKFYNNSVIIEDGEIKTIYSKVHLFNTEKNFFEEGNINPEIISTKYGKIATMICYDLEIPEFVRYVAEKGCELLCVPLNWPTGSFNKPESEKRPMELIKAMSMSATFRIWLAICDRSGKERNVEWLESSSIINLDGWPIKQVGKGSGIVMAEIDLNLAKDKTVSPKNHVFKDFKRDLYQN